MFDHPGPEGGAFLIVDSCRSHAEEGSERRSLQRAAPGSALERIPGHKEARWAHLLGGPIDVEALSVTTPSVPQGPGRIEALEQRLAALEAAYAQLSADYASLREGLADLLGD